ncbi:hypothetical protein HDE_02979 [Halotydeus destructor]|nr:hypothetical protein HDE_02979 [Halotydeus destructor]
MTSRIAQSRDFRLLPVINCTRQSSAENYQYLIDETLLLIDNTVNNLNPVTKLRLTKLLNSNKVRYGPDTVNPSLRKFLRESFKCLNYEVALLILEKYTTLNDLKCLEPDYLFLLFDYALEKSDKFTCDPIVFLNIVQLLCLCSNVNGFSVCHRRSTIELIINSCDPDTCKQATPLGTCSRIAFDFIASQGNLDPDLSELNVLKGRCKLANPLQVALEQSKFEIAAILLKNGATARNLDITNVLFCRKAIQALQLLYQAGHQFPPAKVLRREWSLFEGDLNLDIFIRWLEKRQRGVPLLLYISWTQIRKQIGAKSLDAYTMLSSLYSFPEHFQNFALMRTQPWIE